MVLRILCAVQVPLREWIVQKKRNRGKRGGKNGDCPKLCVNLLDGVE